MKFCPECGSKVEYAKFCAECGYRIPTSAASQELTAKPVYEAPAPSAAPQQMLHQPSLQPPQHAEAVHDQLLVSQNHHAAAGVDGEKTLLQFQTYIPFGLDTTKQSIGGKVDLSIPVIHYTLTTERLICEKQSALSVLSSKGREEIELEKIDDISVKKGLIDRVSKKGDIVLIVQEKKRPLKDIQNAEEVKDAIRAAVGKRKKFLEAQARVEYKKFM